MCCQHLWGTSVGVLAVGWKAAHPISPGAVRFLMSLIEHFWGHRSWRVPCFAMLKAGSACWSLCWERRAEEEGDWETGGVLEQQAGFSLQVPQPKWLAKVPGVA